MVQRLGAVMALVLFLAGCGGMKPEDFAHREPKLVLEEYFSGPVRAWGIFEDRFGKLRRSFVVEIEGSWDGETLTLDERFLYDDGERDRRVWRIAKKSEHLYEGRADDVIGVAEGRVFGNALNWAYDVDLKMGDSSLRVHFNDWLFLQDERVMINRAEVTKFGILIGEVTLFFHREDLPPQGQQAYGDAAQ